MKTFKISLLPYQFKNRRIPYDISEYLTTYLVEGETYAGALNELFKDMNVNNNRRFNRKPVVYEYHEVL